MEGKSIIIIGAGIAGLSAGCYGQMNNYQTRIFEMHNLPGGLCTSWKRQGYTIDGCLAWLVGSKPGSDFYRFWEELGAIQGKQIINHEEYARFEGSQGKIFILYANIDRLEKHMLELAPEDEKVIKELTKGIRDCTRLELPIEKAPELFGPIDGLKMLLKMFPFMAVLNKWRKISIQDFSARFSNPLLREAFPLIWLPEFPMLSLLMTLAWLHKESAGYPLGGSLAFSRSIEQRYLGLGGDIHYNSRVVKILVENNRAVGIRLADGSEYRADYIVSAADGHTTIFNLLDGKYADEKIRDYYDNLPVFPPLIHVALGVNCSFEEIPHTVSGLSFPLDKPVVIAGKEWQRLGVYIYNFDPTFTEAGKTVLKVMLPSDYNYWQSLREDPERYRAEKEKISDQVVSLLDKRFPGMAAQVEMRDVATPVTFHRYTGNWQGTFEGWMVTPETWNLRMKKTLSGLDNFYMIGQWVEPGGGLPPAAYSGRNLIQILCKGDRRKFITTVPKAV
jgi:phytoene dehydrogenase-like protein